MSSSSESEIENQISDTQYHKQLRLSQKDNKSHSSIRDQDIDNKFDDFLKPLPLIPRGSAYQEGEHLPKWKRKQTFELDLANKIDDDQDMLDEDTIQSQDQDQSINNNNIKSPSKQKDEKVFKSSDQVQEKLSKYADQITLQNYVQIDRKQYPNLFKYQIYESYKPKNLNETRKLLQIYLLKTAKQTNPSAKIYDTFDRDHYREFYSYTQKQLDTQIPAFVNEHSLLQFDSHFECGNLDSAYLVQENEYNLLMKVDTNTKGNSLWFYFKVSNGRPGSVVKFNILNFSRDLKSFYHNGMGICVMKEKNQNDNSTWEQDKCFDIVFQQSPELIKSYGKVSGQPKYFCELSFKYKFESADLNQIGDGVYFAYSIPYTYSQMIKDLVQTKNNLMLLPHQLKQQGEEASCRSSQDSLQKLEENKNQNPRQRLNQFELQHLEIRNQGLKLMKLNTLEKALINEQNSLTDINNPQFSKSFSRGGHALYKDEFEIKSGNILFKQEILAYSVGGLPLFQLTITNRCLQGQLKYKKRKVLYICSRVHAGETNASYIMQNIIYELTSNNTNKKYEQLLQNYIVKLVPMINVDGVSIGNGRASLVGLDLNRRWTNPNPIIHPEVYFLKRTLKKLNAQYEKGVQIFCDLHGHNRKLNSFVYGCHKAANSGLLSWTKTRLLPKIIASVTPLFNYRDCRFKIEKSKLNTARVVCWNELKITNSFTLEASMYGKQEVVNPTNDGEQLMDFISQMSIQDYHDIGEGLLTAIAQYNNLEPELEQEFQQTNGWLKVTKLNDVTGKAARDKLQEESLAVKGEIATAGVETRKKSQRLKKNIQEVQQNKQLQIQKEKDSQKANEIRHRKSFIETAYTATAPPKQPSVVSAVAAHNQQLLKRKQSFAQSTTTASGNNQISAIKNLNQGGNYIGPKQSTKSTKVRADKYKNRKMSSNQNMLKSGSSFNDTDSLSNSSKSTLLNQSSFSTHWRDFFDQREIERAVTMAQQMIPEEDNEESSEGEQEGDKGGSDSEPSEDNINQAEFLEMMSNVFQKDEQVSFEQLLLDSNRKINEQIQNEEKENYLLRQSPRLESSGKKGFQRQNSQKDLQALNDSDQNFIQGGLESQAPQDMQSPMYNFRQKHYDPVRQSKDQHYDLQMMKQNQSNRIKILQEQLEELERQKRQQLMLQQHLNQSQSSEQQLNLSIQQYKNPITNQASKTAYQGWNQTKNKVSSSNLGQLSSANFPIDNLKQKSPDRVRGQQQFPLTAYQQLQLLQNGSRLKSSNLFDPSKQKLITEQAQASHLQQKIMNESKHQQQDNQVKNVWLKNSEKIDLSNNIFASQITNLLMSQAPDRSQAYPQQSTNKRKYSIKVNMVVNELERLNNKQDASALFNQDLQNNQTTQLRNQSLMAQESKGNEVQQIQNSQYRTQNNFYSPDSGANIQPPLMNPYTPSEHRLSLGANVKVKYSSAGPQVKGALFSSDHIHNLQNDQYQGYSSQERQQIFSEERLRLRSLEKNLQQLVNFQELKTPQQHPAAISPVMFKRFQMGRFPSNSKREDALKCVENLRSPKIQQIAAHSYQQQNSSEYSPNTQIVKIENQGLNNHKVLPVISLNRAQTQIQARKSVNHPPIEQRAEQKLLAGNYDNQLLTQTFQQRPDKLQKLNLTSPYQQNNRANNQQQTITTSGTGVIASLYSNQLVKRTDDETHNNFSNSQNLQLISGHGRG